MGKCCDMINRTKFINVDVFEKIATAAFNSVMCDVGNFANITANTHLALMSCLPLYEVGTGGSGC